MPKKDKEKKEKVKLKDRKIFQWCKENAPELIGNSLEFVGDITGIEIVEKLGEKISGSKELTPEQKAEAMELVKLDLEAYKIEVQDRENARSREIEIAKIGKTDWLMYTTGLAGLGGFGFMIYAVIYEPSMQENMLAHQLLGMVEGVALSIFMYYFGSSKGSADKTKLLKN